MKLGLVFVAAATSTLGCSNSATPVAATSPTQIITSPAPPPARVEGTITLNAASRPSSGSTLALFDCDPTLPAPRGLMRPAHEIGICTDQMRLSFDVQVAENIPSASLTVELRDGTRTCAASSSDDSKSLTAGAVATFTPVGTIVFSDDPPAPDPPCALPLTTTRVVANLRRSRDRSTAPVLTVEFPITYSFAMR
jgi:hypothetical protein